MSNERIVRWKCAQCGEVLEETKVSEPPFMAEAPAHERDGKHCGPVRPMIARC